MLTMGVLEVEIERVMVFGSLSETDRARTAFFKHLQEQNFQVMQLRYGMRPLRENEVLTQSNPGGAISKSRCPRKKSRYRISSRTTAFCNRSSWIRHRHSSTHDASSQIVFIRGDSLTAIYHRSLEMTILSQLSSERE